ncbi:MAG: CRISPR-associated protein Cas4 [Spirochaetota bacterium]
MGLLKENGSYLELSNKLSVAAFAVSTPVVFDIKYDIKRDFHPLGITGYAMVMEAIYEFPVDIGCIVYPSFS